MNDHSGKHGADRMKLVLERGNDTEIAAAAAQAPEQIRMLIGARSQKLSVGGDDVSRQQVVAAETMLAHQPAEATAQSQPGDAGGRHDAAGAGKAEGLAFAVV